MKAKNKNDFFGSVRGYVWKTVKCQGKIREKSGNFEVDDKWQPCETFSYAILELISSLKDLIELRVRSMYILP